MLYPVSKPRSNERSLPLAFFCLVFFSLIKYAYCETGACQEAFSEEKRRCEEDPMPSEKQQKLYSLVLELQATHQALLPQTTGHLVHAMFLNLVKQFDPAFSAHLHDMSGPRPFTLSSLNGGITRNSSTLVEQGEICALRLTLLDGGSLWQSLSTHLLETAIVSVQIGLASFQIKRVLSSSAKDMTGRVKTTDWQTLVSQPFGPEIAYRFVSPTAFSLGQRMFSLVPSPVLLWESILRTWNTYAPIDMHVDRLLLTEALKQVRVSFCDLRVEQFHLSVEYVALEEYHALNKPTHLLLCR